MDQRCGSTNGALHVATETQIQMTNFFFLVFFAHHELSTSPSLATGKLETSNWKLATVETGKFSLAFAITNTTEKHPYGQPVGPTPNTKYIVASTKLQVQTWPTSVGDGQQFSLVFLVERRLVGGVGFEARRKCICNAVDGDVSDRKPVPLSLFRSLALPVSLSHSLCCVRACFLG